MGSQNAQLVNALCDSSGFCQFQGPRIEDIRSLYNALYGTNISFEEAADLGWQCMQDEWEFNKRAGYDPDLPEWMRTEAVPGTGMTITATDEQVAKVFQRYPIGDELRNIKAVG
jgi:aldehyde:ferredoxin oxidoreductase